MERQVNIGDTVRVRMHHSKPWESRQYKVISVYLNDLIVQQPGAVGAVRLSPDNVQPWGEQ